MRPRSAMQKAECRMRSRSSCKPLRLCVCILYSKHKSSPWAHEVQLKNNSQASGGIREAFGPLNLHANKYSAQPHYNSACLVNVRGYAPFLNLLLVRIVAGVGQRRKCCHEVKRC